MSEQASKYWLNLVLPIFISLGISAAGGFAWGGRINGELKTLSEAAERIEDRLNKASDKNEAIRERLARSEARITELERRVGAVEQRR